MNLDHIQLAVAVSRRGSFAAVARDLDCDPSTVSRAVAALETRLGLRLFQRSTRRLAPTDAGEAWLTRVAPASDAIAAASEEARTLRGSPQGVVRLTASMAYGQCRIVPRLAELRARWPGLRLELVLTDVALDLVAERIDLAVRLAPPLDEAVVATRLHGTFYRVLASPEWLRVQGSIASPADLARTACLRQDLPAYRDLWRFRTAGGETSSVPVDGPILVNSPLALREAALAGLGPALLADWLAGEDVERGRLVDLFPGVEAAATSFDTAAWLVLPSRAFVPRKVRVTSEFLVDACAG